jgi:hypothetical protein
MSFTPCLKSLPAIVSPARLALLGRRAGSGEAGGEERIARKIVDAAYAVHKTLGPGLLEKVYEVCFCHELSKRGVEISKTSRYPNNI